MNRTRTGRAPQHCPGSAVPVATRSEESSARTHALEDPAAVLSRGGNSCTKMKARSAESMRHGSMRHGSGCHGSMRHGSRCHKSRRHGSMHCAICSVRKTENKNRYAFASCRGRGKRRKETHREGQPELKQSRSGWRTMKGNTPFNTVLTFELG